MSEYQETFEFGKIGTIHLKTVVSDCKIDNDFSSSVEYFRHYDGGPSKYSVDGFSGGPVLSLVGELGDLEVVLDGVVVRAGNAHIYIVDTDYITSVLKTYA